MSLSCDGCALCCKLLAVEELDKPSCRWCKHVERLPRGRRCGIYQDRPDACRTFECLWLQSQTQAPRGQQMQPELRPDRSHVVFAQDTYLTGAVDPAERRLYAHVDPDRPDAWRARLPMLAINTFLQRGGTVEVITGHEKVTLRRGAGRVEVGPAEPLFGMLKRGDPLANLPIPTLDAEELLRRG